MNHEKHVPAGPGRRGPHGPGGRMMPGEKARDFKGTLLRLLAYIGKYKAAVGVVMLFAMAGTLFSVLGPKILGNATTELFNGLVAKVQGTGGIDFDKIGRILLLLLGLYLASAAFSFIQGWIMTGITQKICYRMRRDISEKIHRMPMKYFESRTVGEVLSRITNDVDTMGQSLNQSVTQLISSATMLVGVFLMMLTISPLMTLVAIVILPVSMLLIRLVVKHSQKYFKAQQKYLGILNGQVEETYSGHNVVKAFNREEEVVREFNETNQVLFRSAWKSQFFSGMMQPIMNFVGNLGYVSVAVLGSVLAVQGTIQVGEIQSFIQYVKNFTQPITQIAQISNMLQSMAAAAERVFEFLNEEEEDQTCVSPARVDDLKGAVEFDHVNFGYTPDKRSSRTSPPGWSRARWWPSWAHRRGKDHHGQAAEAVLRRERWGHPGDGHDVRSFNRSKLREAFGMVLQDTWLFKGTILENIRSAAGPTDAEWWPQPRPPTPPL
jgi:ATP-binding cassette subfamily B protein